MDDEIAASGGEPARSGRSGTRERVVGGGLYTLIASFFSRILGVVSIGVLGQLLEPADFGVMALAVLAIEVCQGLINRQFEFALVRLPEIDDAHYDTAFTMSLLLGLMMGLGVFLSAEFLPALVGEPRLEAVLRVVSLVPVMSGLLNPRFVIFERAMNFLPSVTMTFSSKVLQAVVAITLAYFWRNYWALIAGALTLTASITMQSFAMAPRLPRLTLRHWRAFVAFGGWLTMSGLINVFIRRSDTAIVGATLPTAVVGVYHMGVELSVMLTDYLVIPLMRGVFRGLSSVAGDRERLKRGYYKVQEVVLGLMLPLSVGAALVAQDVVAIVLGPSWSQTATILSALAPVAGLATILYGVQYVLMVEGDTKTMFYRKAIVAAVQLPLMALGAWTIGLVGILAARIAATLFNIALGLQLASRFTGDPFWRTLSVAWRSFAATLVMALGVLALDAALPAANGLVAALMDLAAKVLVGAALFSTAHFTLWWRVGRPDGVERTMLDLLTRVLGRLRPAPQG